MLSVYLFHISGCYKEQSVNDNDKQDEHGKDPEDDQDSEAARDHPDLPTAG